MKKCLFVLLLVMLCNVSYAEIVKQSNNFDNSKVIVSTTERPNGKSYLEYPNTIAFKKLIKQNGSSEYNLFIITSVGQTASANESSVIKINNDINKTYYLNTTVDYNTVPRRTSFVISNNMLSEIANSNSIDIQIPLFTHNKIQTKYVVYNIPKFVIDEWKQVIEMN